MRTELVKISEHLELVRDAENPNQFSLAYVWNKCAPRDEQGNPDYQKRPYEWKRLPTAQGYINAVQKKLGNSGKIPLFVNHGQNGLYAHYLILLAYLQYLNPELHVEANEYFLRIKAGDCDLIDEIYRNASVEGKARAELRMKSILKRRSFTDELAAHGCGSDDFGRITNAGYEEAFDKNALQLRQSLGITKKSQPLRDVMPPEMLDQVQLYEGLAAAKMNKDKAQGSYVCETTTRNASRMIREFLEK